MGNLTLCCMFCCSDSLHNTETLVKMIDSKELNNLELEFLANIEDEKVFDHTLKKNKKVVNFINSEERAIKLWQNRRSLLSASWRT